MNKYLLVASRWLFNAILTLTNTLLTASRGIHNYCLTLAENAAERKVDAAWIAYETDLKTIEAVQARAQADYDDFCTKCSEAEATHVAATVERAELGIA